MDDESESAAEIARRAMERAARAEEIARLSIKIAVISFLGVVAMIVAMTGWTEGPFGF